MRFLMRLLPISPSTHVLRSIICRPEPGLWRPAFSPIGEQNLALLDIVRSLPHANSFTHYSTHRDIIIIYVFDNHYYRALSCLYSSFAGQCLRPKRIYPPAGPPIPLPDHSPSQRHQPLRRLHCPAPVEYHAYIRLFLQYAHNYLRGYVKTCRK